MIDMAWLGHAIHVTLRSAARKDVDGRPPAFAGTSFAGHDGGEAPVNF
jgi:hypothetical protein